MPHPRRRTFGIVVALCTSTPLLAGGVVEIETTKTGTTLSRDEIERIPVNRDFAEIARIVPNAAGVARFEGDAGRYSLRIGEGDAAREAPFEIQEDSVQSLRLGPDGRLTAAADPFRTSFRPPDAQSARGADFTYRVENQLVTVELTTPAGSLYLSAPEIAPNGGTTTWTSTAIPAGSSERERERNQRALDGMRVQIGRPPIDLLPGGAVQVPASRSVFVSLRDGGSTITSGTVPFHVSPAFDPTTGGVAGPNSTGLPTVFAGAPLTVPGVFDGDARNTRITVNGTPVRVVAESPFGASIYTPGDQLGTLTIVVEEGDRRGSGTFQSLGLVIAADKTDLRRGETTTCRITIHGLAGMSDAVRLVLVNRTPGVVSMAPANRQLLRIDPGVHDAQGTLQLTRQFTGIERGRFHLQAILLPPGARLPGAPR